MMKRKFLTLFLAIMLFIPAAIILAENPDVKKALVNSIKCTGCGDCEKVCPTKAMSLVNQKAVVDPEKCINCLLCIKACNYKAISGSQELK